MAATGMAAIEERADGLLVHILVTPRASRARIGAIHGDRLKVAVTAPPVDGAANAAVIELFASALGCRRGDVEVVQGPTSRRKTLRLANATRAALDEVLG
jgi:uncharacterized protein